MSEIHNYVHAAAHIVKSKFRSKKDESKLRAQRILDQDPNDFVDLNIRFIGASGLPKMDVVGKCDPFFKASLDGEIKFISSVKSNTLAPIWNERWRVRNVPKHAVLEIDMHDKDEGRIMNDYVGKIKTGIEPGTKELELAGPTIKIRTERGKFWLEIESKPCADKDPRTIPYKFDGPIRYSRHTSPTAGKLTNLNGARLYATWKMYLRGIREHFGDVKQPWNHKYKAAQTIFKGPTSYPVRRAIKTAHDILYSRTMANGFGVIESKDDIFSILHTGGASRPNQHQSDHQVTLAHRIKPAVYTYVISWQDNSFRFSETGAAFFVDFASKHALHSKCSQSVIYSGEFHPRPKGGWGAFGDDKEDKDVEWELVIDNNSGTYAPDKTLLPKLQQLLEYNIPGFKVLALDREDEELKKSVAECREYAVKKRDIAEADLQPHMTSEDEKPFCMAMWDYVIPGRGMKRGQETTDEEEEEEGDEGGDENEGVGDLPHEESKS